MKFRTKPVLTEAHQWFKNGDHPEDGDPDTEGNVVRYFRHPSLRGDLVHELCSNKWHEHGWIDQGENSTYVCPGDWIITNHLDFYIPCAPESFNYYYEPV